MAGLLTVEAAVACALVRWGREPFDLATDNCGLAVLDFVETVRRQRLAAHRLQIENLRATLRLSRDRVSFIARSEVLMRALGCNRTEAPGFGDVGLVENGTGAIAAICLGKPGWAMRGNREVVIEPRTMIMAWRVECPRP